MMASRHGRVARTPVSRRDPALLSIPQAGVQRPAAVGGRERAPREEIARLARMLLVEPTDQQRSKQTRSLNRVLDWLASFPGEDWQDRWLLSGSDEHGKAWGPDGLTAAQRCRLTSGLDVLIVLRVVRPSYGWLFGSRMLGVYAAFRRHNEADVFTELERHATPRDGYGEYAAEALNLLTRMVIVTGKNLHQLELADFDDYTAARRATGRNVAALPLAYELLHGVGGLKGLPSTLRQARARGKLSVAELVDRYPIADRAVRDVLVHYLVERAAMLDYGSLVNLVQVLADLFWGDLERNHPGISSLQLPDEVAQAWKQRVRILPDGRPRRTVHTVLLAVRALYLDLQQWSLEDPARWAKWAAPCPIRDADFRGFMKETRRRQARMQERTRALIPVLPRLVAAAEDELARSTRLLVAVRGTRPGEEFSVDDQRYRRAGRETSHWRPSALFVTPLDEPGTRFDAERREDNAFWAFAAIEVLRRTGCRIEELLELTHLSLRQYQAPTGEMVPLLQISPSKTDHERVIPADPDLVAVLARIIRRVKGDDAKVPQLSRYDRYERTFGPPLPHLFQRIVHHRLQVIDPNSIRELLTKLAERARIVDVDGSPLRFTPHDFRRVFSSETVNGGLPIHIAAKLLGHLDLNTTQGYVAVYPEEVISHYRMFVEQRRTRRPSEEYREPSDAEWEEFRDHFSLRKVALGRCDRPYGTPCQHEHACIEPSRLAIADLDAPLIGAFLHHLEDERGNSVRTRNARLAAVHSLFRYAILRHPDQAAVMQRVLSIPPKRFDRALVTYLTDPEIEALLAAPDPDTWTGRRDRVLLAVAIQTGLRASELTALTIADVHLGTGAHLSCLGKGRKQRVTPLTHDTVRLLRAWLSERAGLPSDPLFPTRRGTRLSRDALEHRVTRHAHQAARACPTLVTKTITPHVLRHSAAMRLLRAGVDTTMIALWLGHESVATTQVYVHADLALKERALARTAPINAAPGRYQPDDEIIKFLDSL